MSALDQLKENVAATLESTGVLARIRAELRAEVFAAIEMQKPTNSNIPQKIDEFACSTFGKHSLDLVLEFLQFFGLKHTLSVLKAETHRPDTTINRDSLWNSISSTASEFSLRKPLLVSVLEQKKDMSFQSLSSRNSKDPFSEGSSSGISNRSSLPKVQVDIPVASKIEPRNAHGSEPRIDSRNVAESDTRAITEPQPRDLLQTESKSDSAPASRSIRVLEAKVDRKIEPRSAYEPGQPIEDPSKPGNTASANVVLVSLPKVSALPTANEPMKSDPMVDQLHQIDDLLKQLDTKQKLTDKAKAQFTADSHLHLEEFSDEDDIDFNDDDFEYEPDEVVKEDTDELFPGFNRKAPAATRPAGVECFSDDPSADENALDSFDVVHDVRLFSQKTM